MKRLWTDIRGARARVISALACGVAAVLLAAASLHAREDGAVVSLSVEPTSGRAQVVIGVSGAVTVRDFVLKNPDRVVIDIVGATLGVRRAGYDRVARGGVRDVRYAQNQPNVVRVVLTLAGPKRYQVSQSEGEIRVSVDGGGEFTAWRAGEPIITAASAPNAARSNAFPRVKTPVRIPVDTPVPTINAQVLSVAVPPPTANAVPPVQSQQPPTPRITIAWEKADIRDVLAAFAAFSGRTIIPAKGVEGTVTAEIVDKPWDVAMRAILNANGLDVVEDQNGIMLVNTLEALAARPRLEQLKTTTVRLNYANASAVAAALRERLTRDCGTMMNPPGTTPAGSAAQPTSTLQCPVRGAVTADSLTNSVSITDSPSGLPDMIAYAQSLDVRQPQVNIKAKIILVDRTQLEGLGIKYDLGSRNQHFNTLVQRTDTAGNAETGNVIFLGGNTVSAIANAASAVPNAALQIIYSAALGAFDFTTFLEALQQVSLLDVQAEPSVTTLNYRPAKLEAGTQVPVRTIEPGTGGNAAGQFPQVVVTFRQTGIVLTVTPSITNNRQIMMRVHAENSDVQDLGGALGAVFPSQIIENELLVADGETAVMGGLTQTSVRVSRSGIPFLVELPLIGRLFGVTNREETKRDLLILITPHIVDEGDMVMEPRRSP